MPSVTSAVPRYGRYAVPRYKRYAVRDIGEGTLYREHRETLFLAIIYMFSILN